MKDPVRHTRRKFIQALAGAVPAAALPGISFGLGNARSTSARLLDGEGSLQFTPLRNGLMRLRYIVGEPAPSLNERVGLVIPGEPPSRGASGPTARATSDGLDWELLSPVGKSMSVFKLNPYPNGGFQLTASAGSQDGWYGLGFHRQRMELHGLKMRWERTYRHSEATVPFFFSTAGYGIFCNTPWPQTFDFTQPNQWSLKADQGDCDIFLIYGPSPKQVLDGYTSLCGRPEMPPRWALDPLYICRYYITQGEVEKIARTFRERDIPCGMLGLEPGWEEVPYSMHWQWSKKRFPAPSQMIDCFHALGYHFELWESGVAPDSGYTDPAARDSWFQKRVSQTLDLGVDFFKQDDPYPRGIMSEEMQAPVQCKTGTGTDQDAEAALIANSLYSETVMRQIEKRTGHRGLVLFNSYFASVGAHRWPTAWAADFKTGTGLVNGSLSAHTMVSSDMDADTPEGIHFGYLTPFTLIDSWAFYQEPWLYPPHIENHHRFYAKLRARLGPHLYTAAWKSHTSGIPIMRPMVLEHPDVQELRMESSQHYLGEGLLVGQNRRVYLPAGEWVDYWTGQSVTSIGAWRECNWLEPACGPLWVRAGSILVTRPVIPNAFAEDNSVLVAEIFPGSGKNTARLYEDDGIGLTYRSGSHRITEFSCREDQGGMEVTVHQVSDTLSQGKDRIAYLFKLHTHWVPKDMAWQGRRLGEKESLPGLVNVPRQTGWCRDAHGPYVWIKVDPQWHFTSDGRGAGDPECDTPAWTGQPLDVNGQLKLIFGSETISPVPESSKMDREADSIRLMLNPPERIPLDDGSWLSQETTVYAWLEAAGQPVLTEGVGISLEVLAKDGTVLRTTSRRTTKGRVEFRNQAYAPGDTVFRVHTERLGSVEAAVRVSPHI